MQPSRTRAGAAALGALLFFASACATATTTTVISLADLDCGSCGEDLARGLIKQEGVQKASFDRHTAEVSVTADQGVDVMQLADKLKPKDEEWRMVAGPGKGNYLPWNPPPAQADIKQVGQPGQDVADLNTLLVPGKFTIVDFAAKWCGPCRELDEHITKISMERADVAYRKLDIDDWDSPLANRYMKDARELPYVIVFDPSGKRVDAIVGIDHARLAKALGPGAAPPLMTPEGKAP